METPSPTTPEDLLRALISPPLKDKCLDLSPVKKDRLKRNQRLELRQAMRANLPVLSKQEIRRCRLPYHEAALQDAMESGHVHTAEFVRQLLHLQEETRTRSGPGSVVWLRPQLKNCKADLDLLMSALCRAERAHDAARYSVEWDEMLHLAAHYAFGPDDWWWLGEQLLYQCVSMNLSGNYEKQQAISNFIIGKYLVENGKKNEPGKYYLEEARKMAMGKSWNCSKVLKTKQEVIYIEACNLLFNTLLEEIKAMFKIDPAKAIEVCNIARKRASEACNYAGEYKALLLKGRCEYILNQSTDAIATVMKALNGCVRRKHIPGICEAKMGLGLAYLQRGYSKECFECFTDLKKLAEANDMPLFVAQAYRFLGEYYLTLKQPYEATPLLMLAFYIFNDNKDYVKREKTRTWAAISAGEELFPAFLTLIKNCADPEIGYEHLMKLIRWIDEKEFFWTQDSNFSFSYTDLVQTIEHK